MESKKIVIKQIRSAIGRDVRTHRALSALGLGRIGKKRTVQTNGALLGLVRQLGHLIEAKNI